jgi:hypothetical protein
VLKSTAIPGGLPFIKEPGVGNHHPAITFNRAILSKNLLREATSTQSM